MPHHNTLRAVVYARVSSTEQLEGYSIDAQLRLCAQFIESRGYQLVGQYLDEGKSARHDAIDKRPAFKQMLADCEAGRFDAVVVHKQDRFSRSNLVLYNSLYRLERAGIAFFTAAEDIDYTTSNGRLMLGIKGSVSQWYSDNLGEEVKKGKRERALAGLHAGQLPYGVKAGPAGVGEPDPETYPRLVALFQMAADGMTLRDIAREMNRRGWRNRRNHPWEPTQVHRLLRNRYYLGEIKDRGAWLPGEHASRWECFPRDLWDRAQRNLVNNRRHESGSRQSHRYPLTGFLCCARCGGTVAIHTPPQDRTPGKRHIYLYCRNRYRMKSCDARFGRLHVYEDQLVAQLYRITLRAEHLDALDVYARLKEGRPQATADVDRARAQLDRTKKLYILGDLEEREYMSERRRLLEIIEESERELPEHHVGVIVDLLSSLGPTYELATSDERGRILRSLIDCVHVDELGITRVDWRRDVREVLDVVF